MKTEKSTLRRFLIIGIFTIILLNFSSIFESSTSANNDVSSIKSQNSRLIYENKTLKEEYNKLKEELESLKNEIIEINSYNNEFYFYTLGVDFDTTNFHLYRKDSVDLVIAEYDSIFKLVDNKSLEASEMLALQLKKLEKTSDFFKNENTIKYYPTISPIKSKDFIRVSSPYGWRKHPIYKKHIFHEGIDISAKIGTPIYSTAQGRVIDIMYSKYGYGNRVVIKHAYGFETLYAHMGVIKVKRGQWVNKGQMIGTVGNTGTSTGPHIHYEIRKGNETRDPLGYFYTYLTDELLLTMK